ncbi:MAG: DegT/DnrJ/EryC1/StrS family aminotransferase [Chloroflexi bacterium]|nr:DegT/DnrJ/EryC1/StrS family aminotransferase [Chloroflexota bacterium]
MSRVPFVNLSRQYRIAQSVIDEAVGRVLTRGHFILGDEVAAFEEEFAAYCGVSSAIGVGSGTTALHLALLACGVGLGDEVITVPNTAVPTVAAISLSGATPVFVDIISTSYTMDAQELEAKITPKTKAIIPVHLYGQCADMAPILAVAKRHGVWVIEDAAQAHGAVYRGRRAGSLGDVGCFSFYPTKNLGAYGDGGMVVTDHPEIAEKVRMLRSYGMRDRDRQELKGVNSRLDELQAAILRAKLPFLPQWNERRRELARLYDSHLDGFGVLAPQEMAYGCHAYHLYVVRCSQRDRLRAYLAARGIDTLVHYLVPVHLQPAYSELKLPQGSFPAAEAAAREVLSLPLYPELEPEEAEVVAKALSDFAREP